MRDQVLEFSAFEITIGISLFPGAIRLPFVTIQEQRDENISYGDSLGSDLLKKMNYPSNLGLTRIPIRRDEILTCGP